VKDIPDRIGYNSITCLPNTIQEAHAVGFACSCVAINKHQSVVDGMLFVCLHEYVIDDVLTSHLEHLLPAFIAFKHVIKFVYLILHRCLNLDFLLSQVLYLLVLLLLRTRL